MFTRRKRIQEILIKVIERFRVKGALSEERALTLEELGIPPRFRDAMSKNLGRSGIFVEVKSKYYLSEERLREVKERFSTKNKFEG
jgi:hypothetical protein